MRLAAWMWLIYLACLVFVDLAIYVGRPGQPLVGYYLANTALALVFLGLSYTRPALQARQATVSAMILLISSAPILVQYLFNLRLPPAPLSNLEGMVLRLLPVLMIGLVLVAWHYRLIVMVIYSVGISLLEIALVLGLNRLEPDRLTSFTFIIIVRMVSFLLVGIFINQLITSLRRQQEALKTANRQLTHYASTLETLTVSRERNRMSRELHDTVVHTLSGLAVQLETARAYLDVDPLVAGRLLDQSLEASRAGLQETRRALKSLRASPLDDLGFLLAIKTMLENAVARSNLTLEMTLPDAGLVLPPDVEQCVYRVAQEAVENVVHHANANHLCFKLSAAGEQVELFIRDDGIGFDTSASARPGHFGLRGMRERAEMAGGKLLIQSKPGSGTSIQMVIKGMQP